MAILADAFMIVSFVSYTRDNIERLESKRCNTGSGSDLSLCRFFLQLWLSISILLMNGRMIQS